MTVLAPALRLLGLGLYGLALGMAVQVNLAAWSLHGRPAGPPRLVPWHVSAVTLWVFGSYTWTAHEVGRRAGQPLTWRAPVFVVLGLLAVCSLGIIGHVQRARKRASVMIETDDIVCFGQELHQARAQPPPAD